MSDLPYKRVLLKLSGEALSGNGESLDFEFIEKICDVVKRCNDGGTQIGIVGGGGNFWRGARNGVAMQRSRADKMGMLATLINALALTDVFERLGVDTRVMSANRADGFAEPFDRDRAVRHFEKGRVVIFAGGTGNPYFSTDTGAVLRAAEIGADVVLLAKNIDGVYSCDPKKDPNAVKYDSLTYKEFLRKKLAVVDMTAASLGLENNIPLYVFALSDPENIYRAIKGEHIGTLVKC
ncbi:MAG: UMP kinase [Oscillospiraceae bacterium]|nr:UMP kinase [Oscillospiraceae bacterium]